MDWLWLGDPGWTILSRTCPGLVTVLVTQVYLWKIQIRPMPFYFSHPLLSKQSLFERWHHVICGYSTPFILAWYVSVRHACILKDRCIATWHGVTHDNTSHTCLCISSCLADFKPQHDMPCQRHLKTPCLPCLHASSCRNKSKWMLWHMRTRRNRNMLQYIEIPYIHATMYVIMHGAL